MNVLDNVCAESAEKNWALVPDPAVGFERGVRLDRPRDLLGVEQVATLSSILETPPTRSSRFCATRKRDIDIALVDALVAEIEDPGDGQRLSGTRRGGQAQLVSKLGAEVLGKFGADHDIRGAEADLACDDLVGEGNHAQGSSRARCP